MAEILLEEVLWVEVLEALVRLVEVLGMEVQWVDPAVLVASVEQFEQTAFLVACWVVLLVLVHSVSLVPLWEQQLVQL